MKPALLALALAAFAGQHDFVSDRGGTHHREQRALAVLDARLHRQAVGPPIDDLQIRQLPRLPRLVLELETGF